MAITLGQRSLARLDGVHPDLVRVVKRAAALARADEDFTVLEGVRTREQMCINYGKGRTAGQCKAKGTPCQPHAGRVRRRGLSCSCLPAGRLERRHRAVAGCRLTTPTTGQRPPMILGSSRRLFRAGA